MTNEMSPADYAAITGNNNGFGNGDSWWIILLFLAIFGGWGNGGYGNRGGGYGSGANDNYVLTSDFAITERKLDSITNGLCDLGYTQAQLINNSQFNQMQNANAIQSQIASCCCDIREGISGVNYNMAMNSNGIQNAIQTGFCQTNYNGQNNTRDIIDSQNTNTRAILDAIQANKVEALKDRIAEQNQMITSLNLAASQARQNEYLVDKLNPNRCPIPAYLTCNPNAPLNYSVNYGGCGCNA